MKKFNLLLILISLFSINTSFAQFCPPSGYTNGTNLFFFYDAGTSNCIDRPNTVSVGASIFTQTSCGDEFSIYTLSSGSSIPIGDMSVDFGFAICDYFGGTLSIEKFDIIFNNALKIYPNPATTDNYINIEFNGFHFSFSLYSITGKELFSQNNVLSRANIKTFNLVPGVYLLKIKTDFACRVSKIIIN